MNAWQQLDHERPIDLRRDPPLAIDEDVGVRRTHLDGDRSKVTALRGGGNGTDGDEYGGRKNSKEKTAGQHRHLHGRIVIKLCI
jgi:hypothetical protein